MDCIKWSDQHRLGVRIIDEQHKRLITQINDLYDNIALNKKEAMGQALDGLSEYMQTHFVVEEEFMIVYGYASFELHKNSHDSFRKKVANMSSEYQKDNMDKAREILLYLFEWLRCHLLEEDKDLVAFLNSKGVD